MARYRLVILSDPVAGREDEYNNWYDQRHLGDVLAIDGIESAQRFRLVEALGVDGGQEPRVAAPHQYLALYEIDTDDVPEVLAELVKRTGTQAMPISDALDLDNTRSWLFEEMGERRISQPSVP